VSGIESIDVRQPLFFERNRVSRVYRGGLLFHDFFGDPAEDSLYPEEWVASTVSAFKKKEGAPQEGISVVRGTGIPFDELVRARRQELVGDRPGLELLVKLLDSAIRLPVQAHPDKMFARRHFGSAHGKTEMWIVLATRPGATILFGFRDGVSQDDLARAARASETDRTALPSLLNTYPASVGDVYLIPARVAHAIGAGCLILEVQEPTDFTIQPEAWCGEYHLDSFEMFLGLDEKTALDCFDFTDLVGARAAAAGRRQPRTFATSAGVTGEHLLTWEDTPDFAVNRYRIGGGSLALAPGPSVWVVTAGAGRIEASRSAHGIAKGGSFFLPAAARETVLRSDSGLEVVECLPPRLSPG
jgi:mannose-6-phosphate isomerase